MRRGSALGRIVRLLLRSDLVLDCHRLGWDRCWAWDLLLVRGLRYHHWLVSDRRFVSGRSLVRERCFAGSRCFGEGHCSLWHRYLAPLRQEAAATRDYPEL